MLDVLKSTQNYPPFTSSFFLEHFYRNLRFYRNPRFSAVCTVQRRARSLCNPIEKCSSISFLLLKTGLPSMIFERSLQRELAFTTLANAMALLAIMLAAMMIRIVGFAATGLVDPRDVLTLIGLTMLGYLPVILIIALFTSILFVLTRWCRDSEMAMWMTSGVSLLRFVKPVALFSFPLIAAIAFGAFVGWPWSHQQSKRLRERFAQRDDIALLASGQFRESPGNRRVFFIEQISPDAKQVRHVFVANTEPEKVDLIAANRGHVEAQPHGARFAVLENGYRYQGLPGQANYRITEFQRYGVQIDPKHFVDFPTIKSTSTLALLRKPTPDNRAELAWRAGLPLMAINLMLLAIPLAYHHPRHNRTFHLVMAVLVYLIYSNLLNLMQSWLEQEKLPFGIGLFILHAFAAALAGLLFWHRPRHRPLFRRLKKTDV